jgi:hypothetical protein
MKIFKDILGILVFFGSIIGGIYVSIWAMFTKPIIVACKAFDAGTLTGLMVGTTILKCLFSGAVGYIVVYVGILIAKFIFSIGEK